ncbi:peptidylprolyl isomerase [Lutibacter sp. B2]|nr:peptidylprolyl isomerase [Lutibacter sp. B2]
MNFLKKRTKNIFIMLLLVLAVFTTGCQGQEVQVAKADMVAKIDKKVITVENYNKQLAIFKKNYESQYGDKIWSVDVGGKTFLSAVKENVLEKLITDEVIISYLQNKKVTIDEKEVEKQYTVYQENIKNQEEFKKFLEENKIDEASIKEQIRTELYVKKFQDEVIKELDLTDEKIKKYYDEHISDYNIEQVKASHILLKEEEKAKDILTKVKAGEDFAKLAKEFSEDKGSGQQGGDLGYFQRGMMVPEFEEVAFSLENGQISDLVKSQFGYHIIKVIDKKVEVKEFEEVKDQIKETIMQETMMKKIEETKATFKIEKFIENIK